MTIKRKGIFGIIFIFLCAAFVFCLSSCFVIDDGTANGGPQDEPEISVGALPGTVTLSSSTGSGNKDITQKRGFCYNNLTNAQVNALAAGGKVTWAYNWSVTPSNSTAIGGNGEIAFFPMAWNDKFNETSLCKYLESNRGKVKYLLGFNEPNMSGNDGGCSMLPSKAAEQWPKLEKIAEDFGLSLVSPAMTYSGAKLSNGKVYDTPESWLDEFIVEYKKQNGGKAPRMDYIALHSYMMWAGSVNEGYADKYAKMYDRKIFMTEFCSWDDNEGKNNSEVVQVQEMSQKIEAMDQNPNVAAYAWFQADGNYKRRPWNALFKFNDPYDKPNEYKNDKTSSELSLAGKVYAYLGNTKGKKFAAGEMIPVYEYTTSSNYEKSGGQSNGYKKYWKAISENNDTKSKANVQFVLTFQKNNYANYLVNVPEAGDYKITVRSKVGSGEWQNRETTTTLKAGEQMLRYTADSEQTVAWIKFEKI